MIGQPFAPRFCGIVASALTQIRFRWSEPTPFNVAHLDSDLQVASWWLGTRDESVRDSRMNCAPRPPVTSLNCSSPEH
jgi:hypothetical protein